MSEKFEWLGQNMDPAQFLLVFGCNVQYALEASSCCARELLSYYRYVLFVFSFRSSLICVCRSRMTLELTEDDSCY